MNSSKALEGARGSSISEEEYRELAGELGAKFSSWVRNRIDEIDPKDPYSLKNLFALQRVQGLDEYDEHCDQATKDYKEQQMKAKFNEWVRNRVDELDPKDPSLKPFFDLQLIQEMEKYDELATAETKDYKEQQMKAKFNEWVRNRVDELDPKDPSLKPFHDLQIIQETEKYELATAATNQYKEDEMKRKFNEWVKNRVDELDPNAPDFLKKLEALRVIQEVDKWAEFVTSQTRSYKEKEMSNRFGEFVKNQVDALVPLSPSFMTQLAELVNLQRTDIYDELCPSSVKTYKESQLALKLAEPPKTTPRVIGTVPGNKETNAPVNQPVVIAFDQPMIPPSVVFSLQPAVPFDTTWLDEGTVLVLDMPLEPEMSYAIKLFGVSISGMSMEEAYIFKFTTEEAGKRPAIVATSPEDGQFDAPGSQPIALVFDQPMSPETLLVDISPAIDCATIWYEGNRLALLQPLRPLDFNTAYTVTVSREAASTQGLTMRGDYRFSFFTGIVAAPRVLGTMPLDGQSEVPPEYPIEIYFDRPMDPDSVEAALTVSPDMDYTTSWREANFVLSIEPGASLAAGTAFTFSLGAGAKSGVGIPLGQSYSLSFRTSP